MHECPLSDTLPCMALSYNESVTAEIRAELGRRKKSARLLATALGWSPQHLSRRMTGAVPWSTDEIELVAAVLGVPLAELVSPNSQAS